RDFRQSPASARGCCRCAGPEHQGQHPPSRFVSLTLKGARERGVATASKKSDSALISQIERAGFALVPAIFEPIEVDAITSELAQALSIGRAGVLDQAGRIYAARNILQLWPKVADVWRRPPLPEILRDVLG